MKLGNMQGIIQTKKMKESFVVVTISFTETNRKARNKKIYSQLPCLKRQCIRDKFMPKHTIREPRKRQPAQLQGKYMGKA